MKRILLVLIVLIVTTVGVVVAHVAKKQHVEENIEEVNFPHTSQIQSDMASWD